MFFLSIDPAFCICENKDADELCLNSAADQHFCFCTKDSTISHNTAWFVIDLVRNFKVIEKQ